MVHVWSSLGRGIIQTSGPTELPNNISTASGPHCLTTGATRWRHYIAILGAIVLAAVMMHP
ncbi:hypothetical protein L798_02275 [Zootermopsis nevadensis]|uniref:Uncharacterized protein n=1 Tax=Zootermopsis nevadensis TaxID=136037 RepID=A0A067RF18_ZOONE|nr:hypothetical protein L798_02275 [Zootermopsis nevadensis]